MARAESRTDLGAARRTRGDLPGRAPESVWKSAPEPTQQSVQDRALSSGKRAARCAGFTLVELMIVMVIIGVLASIAIPSFIGQLKHAREAVLREDLHVIRSGIDAYTMDKEKAPQSLDDLVQSGYLKSIPVDPTTHSNTTWVTTTDDSLMSVDQTDSGVNDVHSGSSETGSDGQPYSSW